MRRLASLAVAQILAEKLAVYIDKDTAVRKPSVLKRAFKSGHLLNKLLINK